MVLVVVMPLQVSNAAYVLQRKILFLSFTVLHLLEQKKHMWHHQQGAMVASCGGTSVHSMQATVII